MFNYIFIYILGLFNIIKMESKMIKNKWIGLKQLKENSKISNFRTIRYPLSLTKLVIAGGITIGCLVTPATNWMIPLAVMWGFSPLSFKAVVGLKMDKYSEKVRRWWYLR